MDFLDLGCRASSLLEVNAARGGLDGGDGKPEIGTSGIPLGPYVGTMSVVYYDTIIWIRIGGKKGKRRGKRRTCGPGSAVVETLQRGRRVDDVAAGEDVNLTGNYLAIITTTIRITLVFHWRHCL